MSKTESDSLHKLDINWLRRNKILENNSWNNRTITWTHRPSGQESSTSIQTFLSENDQHIKLIYTVKDRSDGTRTNIEYKVPLTTTPCHFGGYRYWFTCPLYKQGLYCGRRVSKLYLIHKYFGCRYCHNLTYESRKLSGFWKTLGIPISLPDIDEQIRKLKRTKYAGKLTKRYLKLLRAKGKGQHQTSIAENCLDLYRHS